MPLFEFDCRRCGVKFEEILSLADLAAESLRCPACGSEQVERAFSIFATGGGGGSAGSAPAAGGGCGRSGFS